MRLQNIKKFKKYISDTLEKVDSACYVFIFIRHTIHYTLSTLNILQYSIQYTLYIITYVHEYLFTE